MGSLSKAVSSLKGKNRPFLASGKGSAGYDNSRQNIDPHIVTKVLDAKEIYKDGVAVGAESDPVFTSQSGQFVRTEADPVWRSQSGQFLQLAGGTMTGTLTAGAATGIMDFTGALGGRIQRSGTNAIGLAGSSTKNVILYLDTIAGSNDVDLGSSTLSSGKFGNIYMVGTISGCNIDCSKTISGAKIVSTGSLSGATLCISGSALVVNKAQNVGIGTESPDRKLHLSGSALAIENYNETGTPAGRGYVFVSGGALYFRGSSGTLTMVAGA